MERHHSEVFVATRQPVSICYLAETSIRGTKGTTYLDTSCLRFNEFVSRLSRICPVYRHKEGLRNQLVLRDLVRVGGGKST